MRVSAQHWEVFLNICEKHPHLITGKFNGAQGKAEGNMLWATVATKLNGLGLGEKTILERRRAVTDWKSKVKTKASKLRISATQTGGGPSTTPPLTPLEERLINLMGKKGFEGDEGVHELGTSSLLPSKTQQTFIFEEVTNENEEINFIEDPSEIPMTDNNMFQSSNILTTEPSTSHSIPNELLKHALEELDREEENMTRTYRKCPPGILQKSINTKLMVGSSCQPKENEKVQTPVSIPVSTQSSSNPNGKAFNRRRPVGGVKALTSSDIAEKYNILLNKRLALVEKQIEQIVESQNYAQEERQHKIRMLKLQEDNLRLDSNEKKLKIELLQLEMSHKKSLFANDH